MDFFKNTFLQCFCSYVHTDDHSLNAPVLTIFQILQIHTCQCDYDKHMLLCTWQVMQNLFFFFLNSYILFMENSFSIKILSGSSQGTNSSTRHFSNPILIFTPPLTHFSEVSKKKIPSWPERAQETFQSDPLTRCFHFRWHLRCHTDASKISWSSY